MNRETGEFTPGEAAEPQGNESPEGAIEPFIGPKRPIDRGAANRRFERWMMEADPSFRIDAPRDDQHGGYPDDL